MASNAVIAGPTAKQVARNVESFRKARQLQQRDLSAKLGKAGRPMLPSVISKIERGERRIDVDDLIALAIALNVSPVALLLPAQTAESARGICSLTDSVEATVPDAWEWAAGNRALPAEPGDKPDRQRQEEFERLSMPQRLRYIAQHPAGRATAAIQRDVHQLVELSEVAVQGGDEEFDRRLEASRRSVQRLLAEIDEIERDQASLREFRDRDK